MEALIYRIFRFLISDTTSGDYSLPDYTALEYLDMAIEKLSQIAGFKKRLTGTITQTDINNGYFQVSNEIVSVIDDLSLNWQLGGGKKIRFIDSTAETVNQTYDFTAKVKFTKFEGVVLQESQIDIPREAYMAVILYALGLYMQGKNITSADEIGNIKSKSEDGLSVSFGIDGVAVEDFSPSGLKSTGIQLMRDLPFSQDVIFSVKI